MNAPFKRKFDQADVPVDWVDDNEWNAIQGAFDAISAPGLDRPDSSRIPPQRSALSMVSAILPPSAAALPSASPHISTLPLSRGQESVPRQLSNESFKQRNSSFRRISPNAVLSSSAAALPLPSASHKFTLPLSRGQPSNESLKQRDSSFTRISPNAILPPSAAAALPLPSASPRISTLPLSRGQESVPRQLSNESLKQRDSFFRRIGPNAVLPPSAAAHPLPSASPHKFTLPSSRGQASVPRQLSNESLKQRDCSSGRIDCNGEGVRPPWRNVEFPCQFPARNFCPSGTVRIRSGDQGPGYTFNECASVSGEQTEDDDSCLPARPGQNLLPGTCLQELVGVGAAREESSAQLSEVAVPDDEEGGRELSKEQPGRRLPAWMEQDRNSLLPLSNSSSSVEHVRSVLGFEGISTSEPVKEELPRVEGGLQSSAEQGNIASVREESSAQLFEKVLPEDEEGSRDSSKEQSGGRLPAWMEQDRNSLPPPNISSSGEHNRNVLGFEGPVKEESARVEGIESNAEQGSIASVREESLVQLSEKLVPEDEDEEGGRKSSKKQPGRRKLPAWMEQDRKPLFPLNNPSSSVERIRNVVDLKGMSTSALVKEESARVDGLQSNAEQGSIVQQQTGDGWLQFEQPRPGLPWGLQPSSCVDVIKPKSPAMQFRGQIVYSKTESEVNAATLELWQRVRELQETTQGAIPIGFDLEWKSTFERGEIPRKVAVMQLCLDGRRCDVIQIIYSGIPSSLQDLLEAPSTLKVGIGVYGDASKLRQDYQISTRKLVDLQAVANKKLSNLKRWGLSSLALELTGKQVEKIQSIRCGDWEALPLSQPQLQYAATDAFASLYLYQVLASFPNLVSESKQSGSTATKSDPEPPAT